MTRWQLRSLASFTLAAFLGGALSAGAAFAAPKKKVKKKAEIADPVLKGAPAQNRKAEAAIEAFKRAPDPTAGPKKLQKGPGFEFKSIVGKVVKQVSALRKELIQKFESLIEATGDDDAQKPEYLFRLAELYAEDQQDNFFRGRELDDPLFKATGGRKAQIQAEQDNYFKAEIRARENAIKAYVRIIKKHPKFNRMDEVLFFAGYSLQEMKRNENARQLFKKLIKDHPTSPFVPDAWLSFGEFYFYEGDMAAALKVYDKVAQFPKSRVYGFSMYKQAWCYYNLKDYKASMQRFIDVIDLAKKGSGGEKKNRIALEREAKKDVVLVFSQIGEPTKAWPFFTRVGGDFAPRMMERLGEIYFSQGKFKESIVVWHELMRLQPNSPMLCKWQNEVVKATQSAFAGSKREQVLELQRLANVYAKVSKMASVPAPLIAECRAATADTLRELATVWHNEWKKIKNAETLAYAQYMYKEYLDKFKTEKDFYVMSFYYAELLFSLAEQIADPNKQRDVWKRSAEAYGKVVELDTRPGAKYLKESAFAQVVAWKNWRGISDDKTSTVAPEAKGKKGAAAAAKPAPDEYKRKPIPDADKKMLASFDTYIKYVKDASKQLVTIKYNKARIYYENNHFPEAVQYFSDLVVNHPNDNLAKFSANLLLDCLNIQKKFRELKDWAVRMEKMPVLMADAEFAKQIKEILAQSKRKECEQAEKEENFKECGKCFVDVANATSPGTHDYAVVLYNAALCFEKGKLIGAAIEARKGLIQGSSKDPLAQKALYQIAENYHAVASYTNAARFYLLFAKQFGAEKEAAAALSNATTFELGLGNDNKAIENAELFIRSYGKKKPREAAAVKYSIGDIYERRSAWGPLIKHYEDYLRSWGRHGGVDREIRAHAKMGEIMWSSACPKKETDGACVQEVRAKRGAKKQKTRTQVVARAPARAATAQKHFNTVLALYKGGSAIGRIPAANEAEKAVRVNQLMYAVAESRFMQGERVYEDFLKVKFPEKLNFDPKKKKAMEQSTKDFKKWNETKQKLLVQAQKVYQEVIVFKQAHWAIAASARIGQLYENYSNGLFNEPCPRGLTEEQCDFYKDELQKVADPLQAKAIEGFSVCLKKSTELSWYNEWSKLCERQLNQIEPQKYPMASEFRTEPVNATLQVSPGSAVSEVR